MVRIRVERDTREFVSTAVVAYAHQSMGMGLKFTEIKPEHRAVLRYWIADLSGEGHPEPAAVTAESRDEVQEAESNIRLVLSELITLMVAKKILTEKEGTEISMQVYR